MAQVWTLAVRDDGDTVVTGGADGRLNVWKDNTAAELEAEAALTEEQMLKQQDLDNALHNKDYVKAVNLAFELKQPARLRNTFADILKQEVRRYRGSRLFQSCDECMPCVAYMYRYRM